MSFLPNESFMPRMLCPGGSLRLRKHRSIVIHHKVYLNRFVYQFGRRHNSIRATTCAFQDSGRLVQTSRIRAAVPRLSVTTKHLNPTTITFDSTKNTSESIKNTVIKDVVIENRVIEKTFTAETSNMNSQKVENVFRIDNMARSRIVAYISRHHPAMEKDKLFQNVDAKSQSEKCEVHLKLPIESYNVTACGIAESEKDAEVVCCMHAESILNELQIPIFSLSSGQIKYAAQKRKDGKKAPMPGAKRKSFHEITMPPALEYVGLDQESRQKLVNTTVQYVNQVSSEDERIESEDGKFTLVALATQSHANANLYIRSPNFYDSNSVARMHRYYARWSHVLMDTVINVTEKVFNKSTETPSEFTATLVLPLDKIFGKRESVGIARNARSASSLCAMHMELMLDALGIRIYGNDEKQRLHAEGVRKMGRWAPMPGDQTRPYAVSPLPLKKTTLNLESKSLKEDTDLLQNTSLEPVDILQMDAAKKLKTVHSRFYWPYFDEKVHVQYLYHKGSWRDSRSVTAIYRLPINTEKVGVRTAMGVSLNRTTAEVLCCMHALKIIEILNVKEDYLNVDKETLSPPALCMLNEESGGSDDLNEERRPLSRNLVEYKEEGDNVKKGDGQTIGIKLDTITTEAKAFEPTTWRVDTTDSYAVVRGSALIMSQSALIRPYEKDEMSRHRIGKYLASRGSSIAQLFTKEQFNLVDPKVPGFQQLYYRFSGNIFIDGIGNIKAIGESYMEDDALIIACMHAELIIDHVGGKLFTRTEQQNKRAQLTRKSGRWAPFSTDDVRPDAKNNLPPPLRYKLQSATDFDRLIPYTVKREGVYEIVTREQYKMKYLAALSKYYFRYARDKSKRCDNLLQVIKCTGVYHEEGHRQTQALLELPVPERFGKRLAIGIANKVSDAKSMCILHGTRILDALGISVFSDSSAQSIHRLEVMREGRSAAFPGHGLSEANTVSPPPVKLKVSFGMTSRPELPSEDEEVMTIEDWLFFVQQTIEYLQAAQEAKDFEYLKQGKIPRTGDAVSDGALDCVEGDGFSTCGMKSVLSDWCERTGIRYPDKMSTRRLQDTPYIHTYFPVPGFPEYTAHGIHRTKLSSAKRAIAHAVYMLRVLDKDFCDRANNLEKRLGSVCNWDAEARELTTGGHDTVLQLYEKAAESSPVNTLVKFDKETGVYEIGLTLNDPQMGSIEVAGSSGTRVGAHGAAQSKLVNFLIKHRDKSAADITCMIQMLQRYPYFQMRGVSNISPLLRSNKDLMERLHDAVGRWKDVHELEQESRNITDTELERRLLFRDLEIPAFRPDLHQKLLDRQLDPTYKNGIGRQRRELTIRSIKKELLDAIQKNQVVVVCSAAGSGKTTQIPQYILDDCLINERPCGIVVTQPRRISAISVAKRVAHERQEEVGDSIGYQIRLEHRPGTHLNFLTSGLLLRKLRTDRFAHEYSHIIFDEVHERDSSTDMCLTLLRDILSQRLDLKLIIMSATMHSSSFSKYFSNAPVIECNRGMYDVDIKYLDHIASLARERNVVTTSMLNLAPPPELLNSDQRIQGMSKASSAIDFRLLTFLVDHCIRNHEVANASILVFLPGWGDIVAASEAISHMRDEIEVLTLHSSVAQDLQMKAFAPASPGKTKVVLSTNICESSITIPDVRVVIDTGRLKQAVTTFSLDATTHQTALQVMYASKANCIQRAGRAGRTQNGICYRMYTRETYELLPTYQSPELVRTPLDGICLLLLTLGIESPEEYLSNNVLDVPQSISIKSAMRKLQDAGAVDENMQLTPLGLYLSPLPVDPSTGKMILLGLALGCLDCALTIAAATSISPFDNTFDGREGARINRDILGRKSRSDILSCVNAYNSWVNVRGIFPEHEARFLSDHTLVLSKLEQMSLTKHQIYNVLAENKYLTDIDPESSKKRAAFVDQSIHSTLSSDIILAKGLITCMLYPNVAQKVTKYLRTKTVETVIDTTSICAQIMEFKIGEDKNQSPYYVFRSCTKSPKTKSGIQYKISEVTGITIWPLLFFGVPTNSIDFVEKAHLMILDDWLFVLADERTCQVIKKLKLAMVLALVRKLQNPNDTQARRDLQIIQKAYYEVLHQADKEGTHKEEGIIVRFGETAEWAKLEK